MNTHSLLLCHGGPSISQLLHVPLGEQQKQTRATKITVVDAVSGLLLNSGREGFVFLHILGCLDTARLNLIGVFLSYHGSVSSYLATSSMCKNLVGFIITDIVTLGYSELSYSNRAVWGILVPIIWICRAKRIWVP